MARVVRERNIAGGVLTIRYKTGTSGGGFGNAPSSQPSGACLTLTAADEVGLAGDGDPIDFFLDTANDTTGLCRVFTPDAYEIAEVLTNGTLTPGRSIVGYSDSDRGKAKEAPSTAAGALAARWVVKSASSGKASVIPRA